jgi:ABC-type protease/lipase transport system fused ATPase/permease subunit
VRLPLISRGGGDGLQPIRDLDQVRSFLSGMGPPALFDLPWMPLYLGICFAFHFWIGITAVIGGMILVAFTLFTDILTRAPAKAATGFSQSRNALAEARALVGVWSPIRGKVRLDGATLDQWDSEALGRHIGYLPQDVELFAGTIAENIARFDPDITPEAVIAAARAANVHDLILRQPDGYETDIGEGGNTLSAGQRQRIALARALYGDPFFILLDEPNSNLDAEGEQALTEAILAVRARNGIAAVIAHRPSALAGVDQVLVMADGKAQAFGPKDEVLSKLLRPVGVPAPLKAAAASPSTKRIVREEQGAT